MAAPPGGASGNPHFDAEMDETLPDVNITGVNRPAYTGTYGNIFKQPKDRLQPNLFDVQRNITHKAIREVVRKPNAELDKQARHFGLMINKGTDSTDVVRHLIRAHELEQQKKEYGLQGVLALDGGSHSITNQYEREGSPGISMIANNAAKKTKTRRREKREGTATTLAHKRDTMAAEADMSLSTAVLSIDRLPGGCFFVDEDHTLEPYQPRVCSQRSGDYNAFNPHTPKAWPDATKYTKSSTRPWDPQQQLANTGSTLLTGASSVARSSRENRTGAQPCSKTSLAQSRRPGGLAEVSTGAAHDECDSHSGSPSASSFYTAVTSTATSLNASQGISSLQQTIARCGRLRLIVDEKRGVADSYVAKATEQHKRYLDSLGQWLRVEDNEKRQQEERAAKEKSRKAGGANPDPSPNPVARDKKMSFTYLLGSSRLAEKSDRVQLRRERYDKTYDESVAGHLQMYTSSSLANPYRRVMEASDRPQMDRQNIPVPKNDPVQYRPSYSVKTVGRFSVLTRASTEAGGVPTRQDIDRALSSLCKKSTLCYDVRLVETGAAARALWDSRNPAPGVAAVVALHRAFVSAASLNPDPWVLSRQQAHSTIIGSVPWLGGDVASRLLSAYDPQRSGLVRYVRLSVSLVCCARPAMTNLITLLNKGYKSKHTPKSADYDSDDEEHRLAKLASAHEGELFLLRLIHSLYEECEGRVSAEAVLDECGRQVTAARSVGMRIEDVFESLSCCCLRIEDELAMERAVKPLLQMIYDEGQQGDEVTAINRKKKSLHELLQESASLPNWEGAAASNPNPRDDESTIGGDMSLMLGGDSLAWTAAHGSVMEGSAEGSAASGFRAFLRQRGSRLGGNGSKRRPAAADSGAGTTGPLSATAVLRHRGLKDVKRIPRIQVSDYVRFLLQTEPVMQEFLRQLSAYRDILEPYSIKGSVLFDESMEMGSAYGTRSGRIVFDM